MRLSGYDGEMKLIIVTLARGAWRKRNANEARRPKRRVPQKQ